MNCVDSDFPLLLISRERARQAPGKGSFSTLNGGGKEDGEEFGGIFPAFLLAAWCPGNVAALLGLIDSQ